MEPPRWNIITPSQYEWERLGLDFIRVGLPNHDPYRAWANFEFQTPEGAIYEVDLLVLTKQGFWLVEIKSWPGHVRGDAGTWTRTHDGRTVSEDNPVMLANRKAKALVSLLKSQQATRNIRVPWMESQNVRAGRLLLERINELRDEREDFGFETTLSGRSYARLLHEMQQQGYRVFLFFLWLPSADMAVSRVANRVRQGGHNVPEADIRRRYVSGRRNLFQLYRPVVTSWWLYDASRLPPSLIASEEDNTLTVVQTQRFESIQRSNEE